MELSDEELRVLGCLIEKAGTTPEHYPLTTNALVAACNQKSNRDPVVSYSDRLVEETMLLLRPAGLARTVTGGRSDKHRHVLDETLGLDSEQLAVLAVLILRGPQTASELKTRTERYLGVGAAGFESPQGVERVLNYLSIGDDPFVVDIGRGPGQSQNRWAHVLGTGGVPQPAASSPATEAGRPDRLGSSLAQRVDALEARLSVLEEALGLASGDDPDPDL